MPTAPERPEETREPQKIAEGREAEIFAWGEGEVLRLYRDPDSGARVERERQALDAVRSSLTCVPAAHRRLDWNGRPGLLMERLEGRTVFAEIQRRPWRVWQLAALCGRVHAELNAVPAPAGLPDLELEIARRIENSGEIPDDLRAAALAELACLPRGGALCHGDFQPENLLLCAAGPVVIDWGNAARGDSCADFARTSLMMRLAALPPGAPPFIRAAQWVGRGLFARAYASAYARLTRHAPDLLRRWDFVRAVDRLSERIPEEREPLLYEAARLRDVCARV